MRLRQQNLGIIWLGWDSRESRLYEVAAHSIVKRCPGADVRPLTLNLVKSVYRRPHEYKDGRLWCPISQAPMATEFALTRFCVSFFSTGWSLFADSDILCQTDINQIMEQANDDYAVMVVKHENKFTEGIKMDNQIQTVYNRKNWSSVVLWNCDHPANKRLDIKMLNTLPGRDLHRFCWLEDKEIGNLDPTWNHLIGIDPYNPEAKILHYTLGGPWFENCLDHPANATWLQEANECK